MRRHLIVILALLVSSSLWAETYRVVLYSTSKRIHTIKAIRQHTKMRLKQAYELTKRPRSTVLKTKSKKKALAAYKDLVANGARVKVFNSKNKAIKVSNELVKPSEIKGRFNVVLTSYGHNKVGVLKEVRAITGLGYADSLNLLNEAPQAIIVEKTSRSNAETVKRRLEAAGGIVSIR